MLNNIDFSIIIPHKDSVDTLRKLIGTIPVSSKIEIIVVDNSPTSLKKDNLGVDRDCTILYSSPNRYAGGARNDGVAYANGKWLIFADADDYFTDNAFDVFYSFINSNADVVYFCADSVYVDSGEPGNRGDIYTNDVNGYLNGIYDEWRLRLGFSVPWAKMIKRDFVKGKNILFDEVVAANDAYFSLLTGYYASSIDASPKSVYVVTVSRGSLTNRRDYAVIKSRYNVILRVNQFMRHVGYSKYQHSVMYYLVQSFHYGPTAVFSFLSMLIKYGQNPFLGLNRWRKTAKKVAVQNSNNSKYIVK